MKLIQNYKGGYLSEVAKDLLRYATIDKVEDWETNKGYRRRYEFKKIRGNYWYIEKLNGEISSLGYRNFPFD